MGRPGWQQTNIIRSWLSRISSSNCGAGAVSAACRQSSTSGESSGSLPRQSVARRAWSSARCFAVCSSHAEGFCGTPVNGHVCIAFTSASCTTSSARCRWATPKYRVRIATSRPDSRRKRWSIRRVTSGAFGEAGMTTRLSRRGAAVPPLTRGPRPHGPHLDHHAEAQARAAARGLDRLVEVGGGDEDIAADDFLGLGIGSVRDGRPARPRSTLPVISSPLVPMTMPLAVIACIHLPNSTMIFCNWSGGGVPPGG